MNVDAAPQRKNRYLINAAMMSTAMTTATNPPSIMPHIMPSCIWLTPPASPSMSTLIVRPDDRDPIPSL